MREIPFKVDVGGVLEVLGGSLYSRRDTAIRELIQNAHDAIVRRRATDLGYLGAIRLRQEPDPGRLIVEDDGVGLTPEEAEAYLGTLGAGVSGLLKRERAGTQDASKVIGQFGVGLFSAFLIARRIVVESRQAGHPAVRWEAGREGVRLGPCERAAQGTTVTLELEPEAREWATDAAALKDAVRGYADFLPVPIHLGAERQRVNVMEPSWLEPTPDPDVVALELEQRFEETPLDVALLRQESPVPLQGALYASPARTPGFSGRPLLTVTVRRMVISTRLDGLLPAWGSFYRGVLELPACKPVTSREDLVKDEAFAMVRSELERLLLERLRHLGRTDPTRLRALISWHRYTLAGAALDEPRLREVLAEHYLFQTSRGALPFAEVARAADGEAPGEARERVVWSNTDRRQEAWTSGAFAGHPSPCVQATRSFEGALLGALADDARARGEPVVVEAASPRSERFLREVLGVRDPEEAAPAWQEHLAAFDARVSVAAFAGDEPPVLAFLDDTAGLRRDVAALKEHGALPASFGRMIDQHLGERDLGRNQVLLNRRHALVRQALGGSVHSPLASVLRLLVANALTTAGAPPGAEREVVRRDLEWIAETVAAGRK